MISTPIRSTAAIVAFALLLTACGGGGGGGTTTSPGVPVLPTTSPPPPGQTTPFSCPSSTAAFAAPAAVGSSAPAQRMVRAPRSANPDARVFAVTYASDAPSVDRDIEGRLPALGASAGGTLSFDRIGRVTRLVHVGSADPQALRAKLQAIPGVVSVTQARRISTMTRAATLTDDPYFKGVTGATPPLYQTSSTPGQWDMHVIGLEHAFSYSFGSTAVKLAIIDTGEDVLHRDIANAHIVLTKCFITDSSGKTQSVGSFVTDPDGHGTDVTGIAAAATQNTFGFAGAAGNVALMLYRAFPTPNDTCNNTGSSSDPQCSAWDIDIASAINDAVANGANIINLSLGDDSTGCANGADPDTIQGNAVKNAIAHNVIVVAAAGNGSKSTVGSPGCDTSVIAVGASAYNDGQSNGSGFTGARPEYVASYSDYGSTNTSRGASSWGIVAPGGDPTGSDRDNLHWIENIWTSTPFDSSFAGACGADALGATNECRIEIAGTSMATPHVAGAAALILSINSQYASPGAMKALLCSTADNIGDPHQGCGRLNIYRAAAVAAGDPVLP